MAIDMQEVEQVLREFVTDRPISPVSFANRDHWRSDLWLRGQRLLDQISDNGRVDK